MSEIRVNSIKGVSASTAAISIDNSSGTCTANISSVGGGQLGNRNLSINGADMMVAQRGTSTTGLQNTGGVFTIDRFAHRRGGTWANAVWKDEQVNSGTGLFKKALKKTTTTAEGSAAGTGQYVMIGHYIEAQDSIAAFGDGTAEAKSFTVSFYVKASIATTYCLHVATSHLSTNKAYMKQFTVNNPNVWERKTCTIPAITNSIGTVNGADTDTGIRFHWVLDAPTGSQAADTWFTHTAFDFPPGQSPSGYANTLNATFELGGVQIEAGSVATDLEHKSFAQELALCQRYAYVINVTNVDAVDRSYGYAYSDTILRGLFYLPQAMRTYPSYTGTATDVNFYASNNSAYFHLDDIVTYLGSSTSPFPNTFAFGTTTSSMTGGHAGILLGREDNGKITFNAEL